MNRFLATSMAVMVAIAPMAAHANEWKDVPHASYWPVGADVTADMIDEQQTDVLGHCEVVSLQTLPKKDRYVVMNSIATGFNLDLGSVGEYGVEVAILSAPVKALSFAATAGGGFVLGMFLGMKSANDTANSRFRSSVDNCMARYAGGIYTMGPVEEQQIRDQGHHQVGLSKNWTIMHPASTGPTSSTVVAPAAKNENPQ